MTKKALSLSYLKTHEFGSAANALAQWCTSWCHQPRACIRNPGVNPRGIMRLLDVMWFLGFKPRARNFYKRLHHAPFFGCAADMAADKVFKMAASLAP